MRPVRLLTLDELLSRAIVKEITSQRLYADLSQQSRDAATKESLISLRRQEVGHQALLEKYRRGELTAGALRPEQAVDYKIAEKLEQPEISPDMKLGDVFLLAALREKASHEFYLGLAGIHPAGEVRTLIEDLARQELRHKQIVEKFYTEVAFPQLDGG